MDMTRDTDMGTDMETDTDTDMATYMDTDIVAQMNTDMATDIVKGTDIEGNQAWPWASEYCRGFY
jgi:hypothetical protein